MPVTTCQLRSFPELERESDRAHLSGSWQDRWHDIRRALDTGWQVAGGPSPSFPDTTLTIFRTLIQLIISTS